MQVWTLTLTGCVRQDLGSHRVGDSLKHHLSGGVARLFACAHRGGEFILITGGEMSESRKYYFRVPREKLISSIRDLKQPNLD